MKFWTLLLILLTVLLILNLSKPADTGVSVDASKKIDNDLTSRFKDFCIKSLNYSEQNKSKIITFVSINSNTNCPALIKMEYNLDPVYSRDEYLVKDCKVSGPLIQSEEAIIVSTKDPQVQQLVSKGGRGCAIKFGNTDAPCCPLLWTGLDEFTKTLSRDPYWIVLWQHDSEKKFVALDEVGNLVN